MSYNGPERPDGGVVYEAGVYDVAGARLGCRAFKLLPNAVAWCRESWPRRPDLRRRIAVVGVVSWLDGEGKS